MVLKSVDPLKGLIGPLDFNRPLVVIAKNHMKEGFCLTHSTNIVAIRCAHKT
jgi:hypothetical protein